MSDVREEFEAWLRLDWSRATYVDSDGDTQYVEDWVQGAWIAWQARAAQVAPVAPAGQVQEAAASAKALVEIEAKKYSLNAAGMFNSGAPDHGQTIAVQELLAGFDDDEAEGHWEAIMAYSDLRASDALFHAAELLAAAPAQGGE